jgi:hypothetical protein
MFATKEALLPDGTRAFPQVCLDTPLVSGACLQCAENSAVWTHF